MPHFYKENTIEKGIAVISSYSHLFWVVWSDSHRGKNDCTKMSTNEAPVVLLQEGPLYATFVNFISLAFFLSSAKILIKREFLLKALLLFNLHNNAHRLPVQLKCSILPTDFPEFLQTNMYSMITIHKLSAGLQKGRH